MMQDYESGAVILIDKEIGWTSFDVVNKVRNQLRKLYGGKAIKTGHAGTLDPLASGLLILCTARFTKRIESFQGLEKEYTGTFYIGKTTPCYDLEKEPDKEYPTGHISGSLLLETALKFLGPQEQIPPVFSAVKVAGKPMYKYARKGQEVLMLPKQIEIKAFELTDISLPLVDFRVVCSKGTYIRALARDFGESLNSGAYLQSLRRTRIGQYTVEEAIKLEDFPGAMDQ